MTTTAELITEPFNLTQEASPEPSDHKLSSLRAAEQETLTRYYTREALFRALEHIPNFFAWEESERLTMFPKAEPVFEFGSAKPTAQATAEFLELAQILKQYPAATIRITGHTDSTGDFEYNQRLSQSRAKAVMKLLSYSDLDRYRFSIEGYGESAPVAPNNTPFGKSMNRRVEIEIQHPYRLRLIDVNDELTGLSTPILEEY
jgi:outer membrane protein OmpA-like peptidoglycan-associated protein